MHDFAIEKRSNIKLNSDMNDVISKTRIKRSSSMNNTPFCKDFEDIRDTQVTTSQKKTVNKFGKPKMKQYIK